MSFFTERQGRVEHEYFQAGSGKKIYLGRKDKPESAKPENIRKALDYVTEKNMHYFQVMDHLIARLSQEDKDKILPEIIDSFYKLADKHVSSLSHSAAKKYKAKG